MSTEATGGGTTDAVGADQPAAAAEGAEPAATAVAETVAARPAVAEPSAAKAADAEPAVPEAILTEVTVTEVTVAVPAAGDTEGSSAWDTEAPSAWDLPAPAAPTEVSEAAPAGDAVALGRAAETDDLTGDIGGGEPARAEETAEAASTPLADDAAGLDEADESGNADEPVVDWFTPRRIVANEPVADEFAADRIAADELADTDDVVEPDETDEPDEANQLAIDYLEGDEGIEYGETAEYEEEYEEYGEGYGEDPEAEEEEYAYAEAAEPQRVRRWPRVLLALGFVVLGAGVVAGAIAIVGTITHGFKKPVKVSYTKSALFSLRTGECFDPQGQAYTLVSCNTPHVAEVFATFTLSGANWPGTSAVAAAASNGCASRLTSYLNPQLSISLSSAYVYPDSVAWQAGTRTVICEVRAANGLLTGSVRGASATAG